MGRGFGWGGLAFLLAFLMGTILGGTVFGAGTLTEIEAYLNTRITVMLHGKVFEAYDPDNGTKYIPITYQGRTYLPLRAVAEASGLQVNWDPVTETAYLGGGAGITTPGEIRWSPLVGEMTNRADAYRMKSRNADVLTLPNGQIFDHGFVAAPHPDIAMSFDTDFAYRKFHAQIYFDDKDEDEVENLKPRVTLLDENHIAIKEFTGVWRQVLEIEVDIKDVKEVSLLISGDRTIMGNPELGR